MKIQLDTKAKTVTVEENVNIKQLVKFVKKILPKEWEEYSLKTGSIIQWTNPIYIDRWHSYPYQWPWIGNPILCTQSTGDSTITTTTNNFTATSNEGSNEGTYCIETGQSKTF